MGQTELARIERLNGLFAAGMILAAVIFFPMRFSVGVAAGALLAVVNFSAMRRLILASLRRQGRGRAALQLLLIAKMGLMFLAVFLAIRFLPLSPIGFAVGISVFLLSITVESVRHALGSGGSEAHDGRA